MAIGDAVPRRVLHVWMNGELVGVWRVDPRRGHLFHYDDSWLARQLARPLSLTMPLRSPDEPYRGEVVRNYFDNLLPDNEEVRRRIQTRFGTPSADVFDLLAEIGRDCVGAVQLLPESADAPNPRRIEGGVLDDGEIEKILQEQTGAYGGGVAADFRISLAGAQEKTALLWHEGRWKKPLGATPTTHILKLPIGIAQRGIDLSTSVENEWLCHQVLKAFDIPVATCTIETFGGQRVLVVERFDRRLSGDGTWLARLPQEDFCQATGTSPVRKYESDGGPGIASCLDILLGSRNARDDRLDFFRTQVVYWLLAAIDGHAKNFSLFIEEAGRYRLTPRYDVLSAFPVAGHGTGRLHERELKMAMGVWGKNRHYKWFDIQRRHWVETARQCGLGADVHSVLAELADRVPDVLERVRDLLPAGFPDGVAEPILEGLRRGTGRLSRGSPR